MAPTAQGDGVASALRYIVQLAHDGADVHTENLQGANAIALPDNFNIHKLEGLALTRDRPRGTFTTSNIDDFARVVTEHKETSRVFIEPQEWTATAVLNYGARDMGDDVQGHCDFLARLHVTPSPEWIALLSMHGAKYSQRTLTDFVEDWTHCITGFNDYTGKTISTPQALAAFREVKITSARSTTNVSTDVKTERGMLESIEARDADKWPAQVGWACVPAFGLQGITANVRLHVLTSHDTPTIAARIVGVDALREHVARSFALLLQGKLPEQPFTGSFTAGA